MVLIFMVLIFHRAFKICSNFLNKKLKTKYTDSSTSDAVNHDTDDMLLNIWIRIPYLGNHGDFLLKSCFNKK
jgi:hypothetical protein